MGDFNMIRSNKLDIKVGAQHPVRNVNAFNESIDNLSLNDV